MSPEDRGKVIGGVVGGVLGAAFIIACAFLLLRQRRKVTTVEEGTPQRLKCSLESEPVQTWLDRPPTLPPIPPSPHLSLDDGIGRPSLSPSLPASELRPSLAEKPSFADRNSLGPPSSPNPPFAHSFGLGEYERPGSSNAQSAPSVPSSSGHERPTSSQYTPHTGVSATGTFGPPHTPTSASITPRPAPADPHRSDSADTISTLGALKEAIFGKSGR